MGHMIWPNRLFTSSLGFTHEMKGPCGKQPYGQYINNVAWSSCVSSMNFDLNFIFSLILKMTQFEEQMIARGSSFPPTQNGRWGQRHRWTAIIIVNINIKLNISWLNTLIGSWSGTLNQPGAGPVRDNPVEGHVIPEWNRLRISIVLSLSVLLFCLESKFQIKSDL